jgi:hypothetical protein
MQVYAYQAKDAELTAWAAELHERATRKLGEVMEEERAAGKLSKGTRGSPIKGARVDRKPTLAAQGIDKNLAGRARKAAKMSVAQSEKRVAKTVAIAVAAVEGSKEGMSPQGHGGHRRVGAQHLKRLACCIQSSSAPMVC